MKLPTVQDLKAAGRRWLAQTQQAWTAMTVTERFVSVCLGIMIVGGVVIRIQGVPWPNWFTFDEEPFVKNAHNYALGVPDSNDHPPFGKLIISLGMLIFGYNSLG